MTTCHISHANIIQQKKEMRFSFVSYRRICDARRAWNQGAETWRQSPAFRINKRTESPPNVQDTHEWINVVTCGIDGQRRRGEICYVYNPPCVVLWDFSSILKEHPCHSNWKVVVWDVFSQLSTIDDKIRGQNCGRVALVNEIIIVTK